MEETIIEHTPTAGTVDAALDRFAHTLETAVRELCSALRTSLNAPKANNPASDTSDVEELTTVQAAKLLRVSRLYIVKLVKTGKLRARKVGRNRLIPRAAIAEYQKNQYELQKAASVRLAQRAGREIRDSLASAKPAQ
jgi:excisionase family DNA binding protein